MASVGRGITSPHVLSPPRNVEQITKAAQDYEFNAQVPLRYWLRTAAALPQQADIYMREGDQETAYLLLFRHAHLVLTNLTSHPEAKLPSLQSQLSQAKRDVNKNLELLDTLRPKINQRYERYGHLIREREARQGATVQSPGTLIPDQDRLLKSRKSSLQQLDGHTHSELAVKLARQEFNRRADARKTHPNPQVALPDTSDDLSRSLQAIRSRVEPRDSPGTPQPTPRLNSSSHIEYSYPKVHAQDGRQSTSLQSKYTVPERVGPQQVDAYPPRLPPKLGYESGESVPPRPEKIQSSTTATTTTPTEPKYTFASTASLENGSPLRTLFLPPTLRTTFLRIAHKNTLANLETCAFLAGTLVSNALFVSKLVVPAQISTSDTCEMTNESQLFDYIDSQDDLMILGWIHTHPTQTCFMSSRDLHTHAGYQMMLAESIAVVCAPSQGDVSHGGDWGAYRLTDPPGKMAILSCTQPGIFHPHEVKNVYTDALRPGHVVEAKGLEFELIDLRSQ